MPRRSAAARQTWERQVAGCVDWEATQLVTGWAPPGGALDAEGRLVVSPLARSVRARKVFFRARAAGDWCGHLQFKALASAAVRPGVVAVCPICADARSASRPRAGPRRSRSEAQLYGKLAAAVTGLQLRPGVLTLHWATWARSAPASGVTSDCVVWLVWRHPGTPDRRVAQLDVHVEGPSHHAVCGCTHCAAEAAARGCAAEAQRQAGTPASTAKPPWHAMSHGRHFRGQQRAVDVARDEVSHAAGAWVLRLDDRQPHAWDAALEHVLNKMKRELTAQPAHAQPAGPPQPPPARLFHTSQSDVRHWAPHLPYRPAPA
jgi:hypothetical protein